MRGRSCRQLQPALHQRGVCRRLCRILSLMHFGSRNWYMLASLFLSYKSRISLIPYCRSAKICLSEFSRLSCQFQDTYWAEVGCGMESRKMDRTIQTNGDRKPVVWNCEWGFRSVNEPGERADSGRISWRAFPYRRRAMQERIATRTAAAPIFPSVLANRILHPIPHILTRRIAQFLGISESSRFSTTITTAVLQFPSQAVQFHASKTDRARLPVRGGCYANADSGHNYARA